MLHSLVVVVAVVVVVVIVVIVVVVDVPTLLTESLCVARELFSSTTQWILKSRLRMSRDELFEGGTERERGTQREQGSLFVMFVCVCVCVCVCLCVCVCVHVLQSEWFERSQLILVKTESESASHFCFMTKMFDRHHYCFCDNAEPLEREN